MEKCQQKYDVSHITTCLLWFKNWTIVFMVTLLLWWDFTICRAHFIIMFYSVVFPIVSLTFDLWHLSLLHNIQWCGGSVFCSALRVSVVSVKHWWSHTLILWKYIWPSKTMSIVLYAFIHQLHIQTLCSTTTVLYFSC